MIVKKPESEVEIVQKKLQSIRKQEGILGYILRDSKSAHIDLNDTTKKMDYAMLSTAALDVCNNMTKILQMGEVNSLVVESEEAKLLCVNINNYHLSLFMKKTVDHDKLYNKFT